MSFPADDRGLQLERTVLAWRRTALSHLVAAVLALRLTPEADLAPVAVLILISTGLTGACIAVPGGAKSGRLGWGVHVIAVGTALSALVGLMILMDL